jgi:hypothetical protein
MRRHATDDDRIRQFGFLLNDVSRLNTRHFERWAKGLGLTLAQCKVLVDLARNVGTTQSRLAGLTETEPMRLLRIIEVWRRTNSSSGAQT